jgi:F0F1-type ATP synthase epsilon subunit
MKLKFQLFSTDGTYFEKSVERVIVKTSNGEICILPNHAKYLSDLIEGKIKVDGTTIYTDSGFVFVKDNEVKVFVGMAYSLDELKISDIDEKINELLSVPDEKKTPYIKKKLEFLKRLKEELR